MGSGHCNGCGKYFEILGNHTRCSKANSLSKDMKKLVKAGLPKKTADPPTKSSQGFTMGFNNLPLAIHRGIETVPAPKFFIPQAPLKRQPRAPAPPPSLSRVPGPPPPASPPRVSNPPPPSPPPPPHTPEPPQEAALSQPTQRSRVGRAYVPAFKFRTRDVSIAPVLDFKERSTSPVEEGNPDVEEEGPNELPPFPSPSPPSSPSPPPEDPLNREEFITEPDAFGVYRVYPHRFTYEPDQLSSYLDDNEDEGDYIPPVTPLVQVLTQSRLRSAGDYDNIEDLGPFRNKTQFMLFDSYDAGTATKSLTHLNSVAKVLQRGDFITADIDGFDAFRIKKELDEWDWHTPSGWKKTSVELSMPNDYKTSRRRVTEAEAATCKVEGLLYRPLVDIMKEFVQNHDTLHYTPFKMYVKRGNDTPDMRIHQELYTSDEFIAEHIAVREANKHRTRGGKPLETVIFAVIEYSDGTKLGQFGDASIWPFYTMCGNISKYLTSKVMGGTVVHHAYIPQLNQQIQAEYRKAYNRSASVEQIKFLRRELFQRVLNILFCSDEVKEAYNEGVEILCPDNIWRLFFIRVFVHACDYMEKVNVFCIKPNSEHLCPECLVKKQDIHLFGTEASRRTSAESCRNDTPSLRKRIESARAFIFNGETPTGEKVKSLLDIDSSTPHRNAYSELFSNQGKHYYRLAAPDPLHEIETGTWKDTFVHMLRLLNGLPKLDYIVELDRRFHATPPFGRGTIRRFRPSTSAMKQMAARDFEDILQVSIPAFEGLFDEDLDWLVMDFLYISALWHGLAKFRMHTDDTIALFDKVTTQFGRIARKYVEITSQDEYRLIARELDHEIAARNRRSARQATKSGAKRKRRAENTKSKKRVAKERTSESRDLVNESDKGSDNSSSSDEETTIKKGFVLNLRTYKWHTKDHYVAWILRLGTIDICSTQRGELEHCVSKDSYKRVSKRNYTEGIARREGHRRKVNRIINANKTTPLLGSNEPSHLPRNLELHATHQMSVQPSRRISYLKFVLDNQKDPAYENFNLLRHHILSRILQHSPNRIYPAEQLRRIVIVGDWLNLHKVIRVNYTTYDFQRTYCSLNPRTTADAMVFSEEAEEDYPYMFCTVLNIFHVMIRDLGDPSSPEGGVRFDVAFVRWRRLDPEWESGIEVLRLPRVEFLPKGDPGAFGFVDPASIIRDVHLICAGAYHKTDEFLGPSIIRKPEEGDTDYRYHYVGIFSDRDLLARFLRCGLGHKGQYDATTAISYEFYDEEEDEDEGEEEEEEEEEDEDEEEEGEEGEGEEGDYDVDEYAFDPEEGEGRGTSFVQRVGFDEP